MRLQCGHPIIVHFMAWMLLLPLFSFSVCAIRSASIPLPERPHAFRILQTSIFQNPSITDYEISAFLGDVKTHSVNSQTGKITFLQPWANSSLAPQEWVMLEMIIKTYLIGFNRTLHEIFHNVSYPAVVQSLIFCEIEPNGTARGFYVAAENGESFVIFSPDAGIWTSQKKDLLPQSVANYLNQDKGTIAGLKSLFSLFSKVLKIYLQTGKAALERKELPVVVVFARESLSGPDSLLLVCRVTSFYPHPINVSWLQDEKEMPDRSMINSTEVLPNHDLTYQIRSSLVIPSADTHSYSCKVEHSSLGGKSLVIPWERRAHAKAGGIAALICVVVLVTVIAAVAFYWRRKKQREYQGIGTGPSII